MRFLRRTLMGVILTSLTAGLLALAGGIVWSAVQTRLAEDAPRRPAREQVMAVDVVEIAPGTLQPVLETYGEIRSRRTLEIRASAPGRVTELGPGVEEGGVVGDGQLLVRIDPKDAETARDIAAADLADARAELRDARRSLDLARDDLASTRAQTELRRKALERQRSLVERGVGSAAAVEAAELDAAAADQAVLARRQALADAEARVDQADTGVRRAGIAMDEAERGVADTEVRAAFAGILSDLAVTRGGLVSTNERLGDLVDPSALEVAFRISVAQYSRLVDDSGDLAGLGVRIALDVSGYTVTTTGTISRESAAVAEGQAGRLIFATLDRAGGFRPGDFVAVEVTEPPVAGVARLPAGAVDASDTVLVVGEDERLDTARAPVLRRQGDEVIVDAAALAGELVVARRTPLLGRGIKVAPERIGDEVAPEPDRDMVELSDERRARLVAFVESSERMPPQAKERVLAQLKERQVPAQTVARIEARIGG